MHLTLTQRQQFEKSADTARECVDVAAFLAAFAFPVSAPLALFATVELSGVVRKLAEDLPLADYASRTTIGVGRMSPLDLPDEVVGLAPGFSAATILDLRSANSPNALRATGRATFFSAVAADEATDWLTAARRAEERAEAVPAAVRSHVRDARRQEAYHYFAGAGDWLEAYALVPLESWARHSPARLARERERVLASTTRDTPLREVIEANLRRHEIAPFRPAAVASVFTRKPAAAVAEAFDPVKTADVLGRADQDISTAGAVVVDAAGSLRSLRAPA